VWHVARQQVELIAVSGCLLLDMRTLIVEVKHLKVRDGKNRKDKKGFI